MKTNNLLALFLLLFSIAFLSCSSDGVTEEEKEIEMEEEEEESNLEVAPNFSLKTPAGGDITSASFKDKTLVIFFFGNTCPPCKSVAPSIESKLKKKYGADDNFAIIGIDQWDGNSSSVKNFQDDTGVTFPLGLKGSSVAKDFGTTYDRLVVVNKEGRIEFKGKSVASNDLNDVVDLVQQLLN